MKSYIFKEYLIFNLVMLSRIISIDRGEVVKSMGDSFLEDEVKRLELYRNHGINVPEFYGYTDDSKACGRFELIEGTHDCVDDADSQYKRGGIEGVMSQLGFWHPYFVTSLDDTIRNSEGKVYLIDADEQKELGRNGVIIGGNVIGSSDEFLERILPSMNQYEIERYGFSESVIQAYHQGYEDSFKRKIQLDRSVPTLRQLYSINSLAM